jgi:hypothetical protein
MLLTLQRAGVSFRRFQPLLTLGYQQDLHALANDLQTCPVELQQAKLDAAVARVDTRGTELLAMGVPRIELQPTLAYATALRLLRDLLAQGWGVGTDDEGIYLLPPATTLAPQDDPAVVKQALRQSFAFARHAQLADAPTAAFVQEMERRGVAAVFADGLELHDRVTAAMAAGVGDLGIRPELEIVTPEGRDATTGLRLQDVWRYARHFWSIPYQSTPGRNIFYLVRDAAGPGRPVIGIAALGNPILGLAQRDEALGWSVASLRRRLETADAVERARLAEHLVAVVDDGISSVLRAGLLDDGAYSSKSIRHLEELEYRAIRDRRDAMAVAGDARTAEYRVVRAAHDAVRDGTPDEVDWRVVAETSLYRRKRAGTLADFIRAGLTLEECRVKQNPDELLRMLDSERGRRAVEITLRRIKQRAIAENVMEIITCGAVPPYGDLLGGKLVAMLLVSPRVVAEFAERYQGRVSLIASGLKGEPVHRQPNLALLSTSSLYAIGSSQYNRIRVPGELTEGSGSLSYERIGATDSFGTVHFAPDTAAALASIARLADDNRRGVNYLFGEGMSPKLRILRAGLGALGLDSEVFLRHHSPRLLYAARLCRNSTDVLFGLSDQPDYILRPVGGSDGTSEIAQHWRERWLRPRLQRADVLDRLAASRRDTFLLGASLPAAATHNDFIGLTRPHPSEGLPAEIPAAHDIEFIERLYRSANSYADRLTGEELGWIHVDLGLDGYLLDQGRADRQIVVTGNPGDGKTHLIERLRPDLEALGALVLTDANMLSDDAILTAWQTCEREARPLVLAINEWPLFVLRRKARATGFAPVGEALRQVQQAVYYLPPAPLPPKGNVIVVDLNLRNVLAGPVVRTVIERLTHERFYRGLHESDPALANRATLLEARVQKRLVALLERVARRGGHTTMRQLVGFIAYLITGGKPAVERLAQQGTERCSYATLAFEGGVGELFDAIRQTFDPKVVTHPVHDADLWRGVTDPAGWLRPQTHLGPQQLPDQGRTGSYAALKRRFYFEHARGGELLDLLPADERMFDTLVEEGLAAQPTLVRDLVLAVNRFFEPDCPDTDRDQLHLWQSHRFDVRAPETFVALHQVDSQRFQIEPPKLASWVEAWLPPEQRQLRSFALTAQTDSAVAVPQLLVDRDLFLTLREAQRGLGRSSWTRSATRKLTRFVDRLHQLAARTAVVEVIRVRNTQSDLDERFEVQREPARYLL